MRKPLGKLGAIVRSFPHAATLFLLLSAAFFLALPETANAQIWVTSGFMVTPATPLGVSGITFTPGSQTETAFCSTSASNPTTGQSSPAAAAYNTFIASCTLTPSAGTTIVSTQCPSEPIYDYPSGNPTGLCSIEFVPQPNVTYTVNSSHELQFNLAPSGTICGQPAFYEYCLSDPLGYYSMNPNSSSIWPPSPTYTGVTSYASLLAINTVDVPCSAMGTCVPQNIPYQYCLSGFTLFGISICTDGILAPEYWPLAQTSEPWQVKCSDVVQGSVVPVAYATPLPNGSTITATFTPNFGFTLAQAAQVCGFANFDWQQLITVQPAPSPFFAVGSNVPLTAPPGYLDPPPGGYQYELTRGFPNGDPAYPLYYSPDPGPSGQSELSAYEPGGMDGTQLNFADGPMDGCLFGGRYAGTPDCNGTSAAPGATVQFITHLAGVYADGTAHDLMVGFTWYSNNNGTSGGASLEKDPQPMDPGSGTGGATVTSVSESTNYEYPTAPGVPATTLTLLDGNQVSVTGSGLAYSRVSKLFVGTLTIANVSDNTITGPFQIVLSSLQSNVTLANATGIAGGFPYITVPNADSLEPGQSASVAVRFSNPTNEILDYSPVAYSGSFD